MTIVGNVAVLPIDESQIIKAKGDKGAGRSIALDFTSPHLIRSPYMNIQSALLLGKSQYLSAAPWRRVLYSSPTVWACVKALNDQLVALPWTVTTKDKSQRERFRGLIDYYTEEVIGKFNGENYDVGVMRGNRDVLTIPQGGNFEIILKTSGRWDGEVDRVENIDGATLTPTGNYWYPLIQRDPYDNERYVVFHRDEIRRILMNPRPDFGRLAYYQTSPLEMCYLAIDAVAKGDFYYLNLLTETPTAGILDLKDYTEEEAVKWAKSWRELMTGSDALKVPLLYDHVEPAQWIPFGPPPEKMMLDDALDRYTKIIHSCFGIYTQDTGLTERDLVMRGQGSATLERRAWHKFNALVALWENMWNSILPEELMFKYEEVNVEQTERLARALVARANAWGIMHRSGILDTVEIRRELVESGLLDTYINAEELPQNIPMMGGGGINPVIPGQSRWQEQRLPTEGRRQALPAPRQPQRAEWYQRVRPKSMAAMSTLNEALISAFQQIADIPPEILEQIIHDAAILFIPIVQEAKSFTDSYDRWLEEFYLLDSGQESLLKSKALIRKQRRAADIAQDFIQSHDWWDITDEELIIAALATFKSAYEDALQDFANEVQQALFEQGLVESPTPEDYEPSLVNAVILAELDHYAHRMVANLNQGTQYYLKRALTRSIMETLSKPEIRQRINDGEDPGEIIATLGLIDDISAALKAEVVSLIVPRAERAAAFEITNIIGSARYTAMSRMGLTTKRWNMYGPEPCEICIKNAAAGDVPLDFEYDSAFGYTLWPLAHPYGNCGITFDNSELYAIIDTGRELTLYTGN